MVQLNMTRGSRSWDESAGNIKQVLSPKGLAFPTSTSTHQPTLASAECFYLGAIECFLTYWREAGGQHQQLQEVLHRTGQRALTNVWPMIQRALAH